MSLMNSCANIIPPDGGPRDSLPPRLVSALPKDSSLGIAPKLITLNFDEYVTLNNINENLIVSPSVKNNPLVDAKLRVVNIKIKDSLEPNTTYSLNFGTGIKDVNEGNFFNNFTYVFSTGNRLDTYRYRGKVIEAETGKIDSSLIVILHNNLSDTAILKLRPRYYTKINGKGEFEFNYLPAGKFNVYVLPNDYTKKYDDSTKIFAFAAEPVLVSGNTRMDTLYAYQEFKVKEKTPVRTGTTEKTSKEDKRLKFVSNLEGGEQSLLKNLELNFSRKLKSFDTTKFIFCDTNFNKIKDGYRLQLDTSGKKISFIYPWKEMKYFRLIIAKDAVADTGNTNLSKADTLKIFTKRESDYGSIKLRFSQLKLDQQPILQFIQSETIVESIRLTGNELYRKLFNPGNYELRILYDINKNGVWDAGSFLPIKKQPERVLLIRKPLSVKANWDNEVNIEL